MAEGGDGERRGEAPLIPADVLRRWSAFAAGTVQPFGSGLINRTFLVEAGGRRAVFQRLHPVFAGSVNEDLDAVTSHLEARGLVTPRLVRADDGAPWVADPDTGRPWRALTYVEGRSADRVESPAMAREAGGLVARFHDAVADLAWEYRHVRAGVHDTAAHLARLERALVAHRNHRLYEAVAPLAEAVLASGRALPDFSALPARHSHGDLKISNVRFDAAGRAVCLLDLDTLGRMGWPVEMGDALRSWTNPAGEEAAPAAVDEAVFEAAVHGYAAQRRSPPSPEERALLVAGTGAITLELAARFLADALAESYFGWDAARFPGRGEHNLARARSQWSLCESVAARRATLEGVVRAAFALRSV